MAKASRPETQNETPTEEERKPSRTTKMSKGPKVHKETGAYLPARYETRRGNIREDR